MKANTHPHEAERIRTLHSYQILDTDREAEFDDIVQLASKICETPISVINLIDTGRQWFKSEIGLGVRETPLDTSICAHVILDDHFVEIPDTLQDPRMANNPLCRADPHLRFYAGAQLIAPNGLPIGTLCVLDNKPRTLNALQRETLTVLSRQIMRELALRQALDRQDILRREIDHRVKNSLQTIASFINLYRRTSKLEDPAQAFDAIERRIRAISALHEELHRAGFEKDIQLHRFLDRVVEQLQETLPEGIEMTTRFAALGSGSTTATSVGIVVSEFVANSIKHAFPPGAAGRITIDFDTSDDGQIILKCDDNGLGNKAKHNGPRSVYDTLGSRVMEAAVSQVSGEMTGNIHDGGYSLVVRIPVGI